MLTQSRLFQKIIVVCSISLYSITTHSQNKYDDRNIVHVKFKEEFVPKNSGSQQSFRSGNERMDQISEKYQAVSLARIFPPAGVFEEAHRAHGLHQWYEIIFSDKTDLKQVIAEYSELSLFYSVEECKAYTHVGLDESNYSPILPNGTNDMWFARQWHFSNTGQTGGTPGADINLIKAWQVQTGSPNVVVAVIDGGIDLTHDDLQGALWVNEDEIAGNSIDDDRNGYVDDVHGYGFGDQNSTIAPDIHGTHVAGIIGAFSNNGIGVSGIAGGSGRGDGVKMMSCATFGGFRVGGFEQAMVYAADNGAVIAQNSWGGGSRAIEAAIDYFVNRAGYDNSSQKFSQNIQIGPMAGGLVFFAAGNSSNSDPNYGYPGSYENSIAVASTDHNDVRSDFSNFGKWVDISAPGSNIYSTITNNGYGFLSGTSMACPHVSGVAALLLSHIQKPGLRSKEVWNRIKFSARSLLTKNPTMKDLLGSGRVDAFVALKEPDAIAPAPIQDLRAIDVHSSSLTLMWTATGENDMEGQAAEYEIRYSITPIDESNFSNANLLSAPLPPLSGESVSLEVKNLQPSTIYFFAIKSRDIFLNQSAISNLLNVRTLRLPGLEVLTKVIDQDLYTGGKTVQQIQVKNIGEEDELVVRLGVPKTDEAPLGLSSGTKGRLFAINTTLNTIDELHLNTGAVLNSIKMPVSSSKLVEGLAFDGSYIFYGRASKIYKIDAQNGKVVREITLGTVNSIRGLAWSGQYLYASINGLSNGVYTSQLCKIDVDTGEIIKAFDSWSNELTFSSNRNSVIGINGQTVVEFDPSNGQVLRELYTGYNPSGLGYSEVSKLLFISEGGMIKAFNIATGIVEYSFPYAQTTALASDEFKMSWLEVSDAEVKIAAGAIVSLPVNFIATDLNSGQWSGSVKVHPLNVNTAAQDVSIKMRVTGAAEIDVASKLDLDDRFIGFSIDTVITIQNRGYADLVVSSISTQDNRINLSLSSATLARNQKVDLRIIITPQAEGRIETMINIVSNDIDEGNLSIPLRVNVLNAPDILLDPSSLSVVLSSGESKSVTLNVTNSGGSTLYWSSNLLGFNAAISSQTRDENADVKLPLQTNTPHPSASEEFEPLTPSPEPITCLSFDNNLGMIYAKAITSNKYYRYDPAIDNWVQISAAPDTFTGQAAYLNGKIYHGGKQLNVYNIQTNSWSSVPFPTAVEADNLTTDGQYIYIALDRVFVNFLYGYTKVYRFDPITNEWLQLADTPSSLYGLNGGGMSFHSGVIYVHLNSREGISGDGNTPFFKYYITTNTWLSSDQIQGRAYSGSAIDPSSRKYYTLGSSPVQSELALMSVRDLTIGGWVRKLLPFVPENRTSLVFVGKSDVSGIYLCEGFGGTDFYRYKTDPAPEWVSILPSKGRLAPGETQTLTVNLNAKGQDGGFYNGAIRVYTNQPEIEKKIPLSISVVGAPDLTISKTEFNFNDVELNRWWGESFKIRNIGTAPLIVSGVSSDDPSLTTSKSAFTLPTGEELILYVYLNSPSIGDHVGTVEIHSNDPDQSNLKLTVRYRGTYSPEFEMIPSEITVKLYSGAKYSDSLKVKNIGLGSTSRDYFVVDDGRSGWMSVHLNGPLEPEEVKGAKIFFDATGKEEGIYNGKLQVWYFGEIRSEIPVTMIVTAAADISTSVERLDFGERFINNTYDSTIQIINNGVKPLHIESVSTNNPFITITPSLPITLQPAESLTAKIRFDVANIGPYTANISFQSDDPDEGNYVIQVFGEGVNPPVVLASEEIVEYIDSNDIKTVSFSFNNTGGSNLRWALEAKSLTGSEDDFSLKAESTNPLIAPVVDLATGSLYAHSLHYQKLYMYQVWGYWEHIRTLNFPYVSDTIGGAVILDSKMYCTYPVDPSKIYVYDIRISEWLSVPNELGSGSATITSDGTLLYLAGGGRFKSYNPKTDEWNNLPIPTINLNGKGGLSYLNGSIYAHEGGGLGFAKYSVATRVWETLPSLPSIAVLGSTIDPIKKRYYAYGKNESNGTFIFEYDVAANYWYVRVFDKFEVSDGGLAYVPTSELEGIYFIQGVAGKKFAKYEASAELPWLRVGSYYGNTKAASVSTVAINFNAYKLNTGTYQGAILLSSNDPVKPSVTIPVKLNVTNPGPTISLPNIIQGVFEKSSSSQVVLKLENKSGRSLQWNFVNILPFWLSANTLSGIIPGNSSQEITLTVSPSFYNFKKIDYRLDIASNDPLNPLVSTYLDFIINNSPIITNVIPTQSLTTKEVSLSLNNHFIDPDNDPMFFSAVSDNNLSAIVSVLGNTLNIKPGKTGISRVKVKAIDTHGFSVEIEFIVNVDDLITGVEPIQNDILFIFPNPSRRDFTCMYTTNSPGTASIEIVDTAGRCILKTDEYQEIQGRNEYYSDLSSVAPGLYILKLLRNGSIIQSTKIVKY